MILELGSKASYANADVQHVWETIEARVTRTEAENAVDRAAAEVRATCGRHLDRVAYGWSGGKDSLALEVVMERAGIHRGVMGVVAPLEFRNFLVWAATAKPPGIQVISADYDLPWLATHPARLFPPDSRLGNWWTIAGTRSAQTKYRTQHRPALMIYGRRTADGNICGDSRGIAVSKEGAVYNPLRHWPHELVLAVIHYLWTDLGTGTHPGRPRTLPPVYSAPDGWTSGNGPWPGRRFPTWDDGWASTWAIEPSAVRKAAAHIPQARDWIRRTGRLSAQPAEPGSAPAAAPLDT